MSISATSKQYNEASRRWEIKRATAGGQDVIKGKTGGYNPKDFLPAFYPPDPPRYGSYLERALFTNFIGPTQTGLSGAVNRRPHIIELPDTLQFMIDNGTIKKLIKEVIDELLEVGRIGLLVDPDENGVPQILPYYAEAILGSNGGIRLYEPKTELNDWVETGVDGWRLLAIDDGGKYYQQAYGPDEKPVGPPVYPTDSTGNMLDEIPFQFLGAKTNSPSYDRPPLLDMAMVNIAHYRNSADQEDNLHRYASATILLWSDMSVEQFTEANPNGIVVGGPKGHFLGSNGGGQLLQLEPAEAIAVAMDKKVELMIGLGARFIENRRSGDRTATEVNANETKSASDLSTLVDNAEDGLRQALKWCALFAGGNPDLVSVGLNNDFFDLDLTPQEITAMLALADAAQYAPSDIHRALQRSNWMPEERSYDDVQGEIEGDGL